jgi:hypothetical protein
MRKAYRVEDRHQFLMIDGGEGSLRDPHGGGDGLLIVVMHVLGV